MAKNYVCDDAKIECKLCTKPEGKLKVTSNEIKIQDKLFANAKDKEKVNLIFQGNCKKSPYQSQPCQAVIKTEEWQGTADLIVQDDPALLEDSTIMCTYGGAPIKITDHLQKNEPGELQPVAAPVIAPIEDPMITSVEWKNNNIKAKRYRRSSRSSKKSIQKINSSKSQQQSQNTTLKKFMVHFRRPSNYVGKYGFDWLRDEYIYPIVNVTNDNNGTSIGTPTALCKNVAALKTEYKTTDMKNPISPYGKDYYPAWLSIFPSIKNAEKKGFPHASTMHKNGVDLDIEIEEIEALVNDDTELLFESGNPFLKITPEKLKLKDLISTKKTKNLGGTATRDYYEAKKKVNIKCTEGALTVHEEIKVFAKLGTQKEEVGKLMVYKNNVIPKAEIVAVNVITGSSSASLRNDYQYLFKNQSFNQALIRAEVKVDTQFNINSLPATDADVIAFKANYINATSNIGTSNSTPFKNDLIALYEKFGRHAPTGTGIDTNVNKRTYLFYTTIRAQDNFAGGGWSRIQGSCSAKKNYNASGTLTGITWGNAYVIYATALKTKRTVLHEGAHSFSLTHTFQEGVIASPHIFYKGFTDNIMDYVNQVGVRTRNPFEANDKMNNFYKWQWDILRADRSLILSN